MKRFGHQRIRRRGATIVETAIVLNVALLFLLGIFDYARFVMTRTAIDNAVREAARYAVVNTQTLTTSDIQTRATNCLGGIRLTNMNVLVYKADLTTGANLGAWTDASLSDGIAVEINGDFKPIVPTFSLLPNPLRLVSKSIMHSEAN